mmetsp:Transcript_6220/g.10129  ORF Transcript_6220/g.10129 Transcript_6220/m.10129 type:complete len:264 (+) Transcript_6220:156-947(+)
MTGFPNHMASWTLLAPQWLMKSLTLGWAKSCCWGTHSVTKKSDPSTNSWNLVSSWFFLLIDQITLLYSSAPTMRLICSAVGTTRVPNEKRMMGWSSASLRNLASLGSRGALRGRSKITGPTILTVSGNSRATCRGDADPEMINLPSKSSNGCPGTLMPSSVLGSLSSERKGRTLARIRGLTRGLMSLWKRDISTGKPLLLRGIQGWLRPTKCSRKQMRPGWKMIHSFSKCLARSKPVEVNGSITKTSGRNCLSMEPKCLTPSR